MKKLIQVSQAFVFVFALSASAFAAEPVCKIRTMGGGSLGMTFTLWKQVEATSLEECQKIAAALVGKTELSEEPTNGSVQYYRPWKAWYKWQTDGETTKGSYTAEKIFEGPSRE